MTRAFDSLQVALTGTVQSAASRTRVLRSVWVGVCLGATVALMGCQPRGESHTLDQILRDARSAYEGVTTAPNGKSVTAIEQLPGVLDRLAGLSGGGDVRQLAGEVVNLLSAVLPKASFTVRPGLTELINQYQNISAGTTGATRIGAPEVKLLVARTYTALAAERSTVNFAL